MKILREYEQFVCHNRNEMGVVSALFREPDKGLRLAHVVVPLDLDGYFSLSQAQTQERLVRHQLNGAPIDQTMYALRTWPRA